MRVAGCLFRGPGHIIVDMNDEYRRILRTWLLSAPIGQPAREVFCLERSGPVLEAMDATLQDHRPRFLLVANGEGDLGEAVVDAHRYLDGVWGICTTWFPLPEAVIERSYEERCALGALRRLVSLGVLRQPLEPADAPPSPDAPPEPPGVPPQVR